LAVFLKGDLEDVYKLDFNDTSWNVVDLPHDWSIKEQMDSMWASCTGYLSGEMSYNTPDS